MTPIYNSIRKALDAVLSEIVAVHTDLLNTANAQRTEMLDLVARMQATRANFDALGAACGEIASELSDLYCDTQDISAKIGDALDEPIGRCPSTPYENLVGFCEECGKEVTYEDFGYQYNPEDDSVICVDCSPATEELAESVAGV